MISVLTVSELVESLTKMAEGLMDRYDKAGKEPPTLLYTDRDCCCQHGKSKLCVSQSLSLSFSFSLSLSLSHE